MSHAYPLGQPVNRSDKPQPVPVPGRPNWFTLGRGAPYYVEPEKPKPTALHNAQLWAAFVAAGVRMRGRAP